MGKEARIGLFGGTFDPIHMAHLVMAEMAIEKMRLRKVIFVPAGEPWLKADKVVSPAEQRLQLVRLATKGNPNFEVSNVEVDRPGPSYTVATVDALRTQWGEQASLFLILGVDALLSLPEWKEPARLVKECQFIVLPRSGSEFRVPEGLERNLPGISSRVAWLEAPEIGISSTCIRDRVARGLSIRYLVPESVESYIRKYRMYVG
jgi:nicotinate-nucleotide adenylyltransferase